jgi:hypothetical protein
MPWLLYCERLDCLPWPLYCARFRLSTLATLLWAVRLSALVTLLWAVRLWPGQFTVRGKALVFIYMGTDWVLELIWMFWRRDGSVAGYVQWTLGTVQFRMLHELFCRSDIVTVILCGVKFGVLQQERGIDWRFLGRGWWGECLCERGLE